MPQLGETVTEGTIIRWLKQVGDQVAQDDPLFEVSTDKVDSEVPSSSSGILAEILVPEGGTVDVGTKIAVISDDAQAPGASTSGTGSSLPAGREADARPVDGSSAGSSGPAPSPGTEVGGRDLAGESPELSGTVASSARQRVSESGSRPSDGEDQDVGGDSSASSGLLLSPVVRKLIAENGVDPALLRGSGQGGRITRGDVLAYLEARGRGRDPGAGADLSEPRTAAAAPDGRAATRAREDGYTSSRAPAPLSGPPLSGARDEVVPFTNIRRRTAEHMVRSKATSAHTLVAFEADFEGIEQVRRREKERFKEEEGFSLSYLPFIARAVVDTLRSYPHLNASVGEEALIVHRDIHLGVAVDLDLQGLIVPVVRNADGQSLRGIARSVSDLAARGRVRKLSADDISGGTFTITNPGPFGTFLSVPIINQPQVAILSTDGVRRRPVVVSLPDTSEAIAIHSVGMLALSFDHRAVDGAYASAFLRDLARVIETRDWAAEL